jgi:hypothetical protein
VLLLLFFHRRALSSTSRRRGFCWFLSALPHPSLRPRSALFRLCRSCPFWPRPPGPPRFVLSVSWGLRLCLLSVSTLLTLHCSFTDQSRSDVRAGRGEKGKKSAGLGGWGTADGCALFGEGGAPRARVRGRRATGHGFAGETWIGSGDRESQNCRFWLCENVGSFETGGREFGELLRCLSVSHPLAAITPFRRDKPGFVRSYPDNAGMMGFILHLDLPSLLTNDNPSRVEGHRWRADRDPRASR